MQISSRLTRHPGVESALVGMATGVNLELLGGMGFDPPADAAPNDMLVALVTTDTIVLSQALELLETELSGTGPEERPGSPGTGGGVAPRTTATAAALVPAPRMALVSTPGRYAFVEAMDALDAGLSVMVFSDNMPVDQEVRLKRAATERGLLVLGPDCGTAVIGGVGLGFANVVRPGQVGIVAASGTGAQHVMSLLSAVRPVGISHCLGVGGRDMSAAVGGLSTHAALDALDADEATELIVLIGKPPAPAVAEAVRAHADRLDTPVLFAPLGEGQPDLTAAVEQVLGRLGVAVPRWSSWEPPARDSSGTTGLIRGLFSGGTLCVEAMVIAAQKLGTVRSNVPIRPEWTLDTAAGHTMIDLGADEYTVGRPHPMIDFGPRLALMASDAADPACRVLLLDVVLGHGAHPDPAAELAPALRAALADRPDHLTVVISLIGSPDDPQDLNRQAMALRDAGAWVFASNAAAARHAVAATGTGGPQ
jgi:FdrA protein